MLRKIKISRRRCAGRPVSGSPSGGFRDSSSASGFTLIEILIAISIFAVVVTTIFGSFNFVFGSVDAIESGMSNYEAARDGLNRILADLRSMYVSQLPVYTVPDSREETDPYRVMGDIVAAGGGLFSRLRFTSFSHLPLGQQWRQGIAEIVYYVQEQPDATLTLKRLDRLDFSEPLAEERNDPILCENVRALRITYQDAEGDEQERWDSDAEQYEYATPRAIRIQLAVGTGEQPHEFEVLIALPLYRDNPEETRLQTIPADFGSPGT